MAELYSSVLIVGIVVGLSYFLFTQAAMPRHTARFLVIPKQHVIYGNPSLLSLQVNASAQVTINEFRIDAASSLMGVLSLGQNGYTVTGNLCASGLTTFFSILARTAGSLKVSTDGQAWVDGSRTHSASVDPGWHEVIIENGSVCSVTPPSGAPVYAPSASVSMVPLIGSMNATNFESYVPFVSSGHSITIVSEAGVETVGF